MEPSQTTLCMVGCGFTGTQIALRAAVAGHTVFMVDVSEESRKRAQRAQDKELTRRVESGAIDARSKDSTLSRIHIGDNLVDAAKRAEIVIEAVDEDRDLKKRIFGELDSVCAPATIFASNSASIRISSIEDATNRPENVLNAHFIPPLSQRRKVELMRGTRTTDETMEIMQTFATSLGLTPLIVEKENTGFIFNRVWRAIKKETLQLAADGVAAYENAERVKRHQC